MPVVVTVHDINCRYVLQVPPPGSQTRFPIPSMKLDVSPVCLGEILLAAVQVTNKVPIIP